MNRSVFFAVALLPIISACHTEEVQKESAQVTFSEGLVKDTTIYQEYVSQIHAIRHIELRAMERGYLTGIYVDEGQFIQKGQTMFQIMPNMLQAETNRAASEAEMAAIEYSNTKKLADENVVSQNELKLAEARKKKADAELDLARVHLGLATVKAPFGGVMDHFHVREGSLVDEGELLTTLSDISTLWVYFNMPEAEYLNLAQSKELKNKQVHLLMANGQTYEHPGTIETIEGEFDHETGNIQLRARFSNPSNLLRHGETGKVLLPTVYPHALIIPQKATYEILDKKYVYVVDAEGIAHQRQITISHELNHLYVIYGGLKPGEKFIVDGLRKVRDGQHVEGESISAKEVIESLELHAE